MDPRAEAFEAAGRRYDTRVLEPSPPAVQEAPWFADDPVARGETADGRQVVSPVGTGDLRWVELVRQDERLADFCRERWLGPWPRLEAVPPGFAETRLSLHAVAEQVMKPAREHANGKFGLRFTRGGFGTPFFGDDAQLRVELGELVVTRGAEERRGPIGSLAGCGRLAGALMPAGHELGDEPLTVDPAAAAALGDWFGFAASVLEELRAEAGPELESSRVQLWPEHFDMAVELGSEEAGERAGYGCSPGDEEHPEPYLYVAPWTARPEGELWNATAFPGAELPYAALLDAADQREAGLQFFHARLSALTSQSTTPG
jgi:hypothetical protein